MICVVRWAFAIFLTISVLFGCEDEPEDAPVSVSYPAPIGPCPCLGVRDRSRNASLTDAGVVRHYSGGLFWARVLAVGGGEIRTSVTELLDPQRRLSEGDAVGGTLEFLCPGGAEPAVGDEVLAMFHFNNPKDSSCEPYVACVQQRCTPPGDEECGCYERYENDCREFYKLEGVFTLLDADDDQITYQWAGAERTETLDELIAEECWDEHDRLLAEDAGTDH